MKKHILLLILATLFLCQCKKAEPTSFDKEAIQQKVSNMKGQSISLAEVFANAKGQIVLIDIWASWCGDCIKSIPEIKKFKKKYGNKVKFLYFSMDKEKQSWKEAIAKYELEGEHIYLGSEWKSKFNTSINLKWIPRFMILDKDGSIKLYNAEQASDSRIEETLQELLNTK